MSVGSGRLHQVDSLFRDHGHQQPVPAGNTLMRQNSRNTRLFLVRHGRFTGWVEQGNGERLAVLTFGPGELVGIQSVYLNDFVSTLTVEAEVDSTVSWIDLAENRPADLEQQLIPLLVRALLRRQEQAQAAATRERAEALRRQEVDQMAFVGQMAAAVAHELNNALAVIARGGEWLGDEVARLTERAPALERQAFDHAFTHGRPHPDPDRLAGVAARLRQRGLDFAVARRCAQIDPDPPLLDALAEAGAEERRSALQAWELGATLRDMARSSRQAAHVVTALKQLGASARLRDDPVDIDESLRIALSIAGNKLHPVRVDLQLGAPAPLPANEGELVQIWANLIGNACDAMASNATQRPPHLVITTVDRNDAVQVMIADNGPGIPEDFRHRIFEPNVTTKKAGLSFGLGLGLTIVRKLVTIYGGEIGVATSPTGTTFTVSLPRQR